MDNSDLGRVGDAEQATQQSPSPTVSALSGEYPSRGEIVNEARRYAAFYPQGSDGRNTFEMFAEFVGTRT